MKQVRIEKYTDLELALMSLLGYFGVGVQRKDYLGERYGKVQPLVNELARGFVPVPDYVVNNDTMLACLKNALLKVYPGKEDYEEYVKDLLDVVKKEVTKNE